MPNSFDTDPRSPSTGRLLVLGVCFVVIASLISVGLYAKSKGQFDRLVRVTAELVNVGDGLPENSDVKFRGILVGFVTNVKPATVGKPNVVHLSLRREFATTIPGNVTARVVPSNVFAVSSVQLVDNGPAAPVRPGQVIPEDSSLPTVLFQTTLNKLRQLLAAVGRSPAADGIGALTALGQAVEGRGPRLREAASGLSKMVTELNEVVSPDDAGPSTIMALAKASNGLKNVAPTLYDALAVAIEPARTLAEKRVALTNFMSAGLNTTSTLRDAFDNQMDRLLSISIQLTPVIGVLADNAHHFHPIAARAQNLSERMMSVWDPRINNIPQKVILSLTPFRQYVRADCPRYGELLGPSCYTAPEVPTTPALKPALEAAGYPPDPSINENRPNLAPPRDSVGSVGRFDDGVVLPPPGTPPPGGPPPGPATPTPPAPAPLPAEASAFPDAPNGPITAIQQQSAQVGSIGPVGSKEETDQLSRIVGGPANAADVLMLGPLARGTTVTIAPDPGPGPAATEIGGES